MTQQEKDKAIKQVKETAKNLTYNPSANKAWEIREIQKIIRK